MGHPWRRRRGRCRAGASAIAELVDASRRGRAIGVYGLAVAVPQLILVPSAAWIAESVDFRVVFVLGALPALAVPFAAALSRWLVGGPADRFGPRRFVPPLLVVCAGGLALCAWSLSDGGPGAAVLVAGMTVVGVAYGSLQNLTLVTAFAAVPDRDRSVASAVWNIGFDTGTGLGSLVVGFIAAGTSFSVGLLTTAALCVVVAAVALVGGRGAGRRSA